MLTENLENVRTFNKTLIWIGSLGRARKWNNNKVKISNKIIDRRFTFISPSFIWHRFCFQCLMALQHPFCRFDNAFKFFYSIVHMQMLLQKNPSSEWNPWKKFYFLGDGGLSKNCIGFSSIASTAVTIKNRLVTRPCDCSS